MAVVLLTAAVMVVEVAAGYLFGSMALLVDGWHMGTHVAALGMAIFAYRYARRHERDPKFTFGTGKVGVLGGFASAVALAVVALLMAAQSIERLFSRPTIRFDEALGVAVIGLAANVASALVLGRGRVRAHSHHEHGHHGPEHDHNLRAAYLHVMADALTSVLAIAALVAAKLLGWVLLDPVMGMIGGAMIARWSYMLLRDSGRILLDADVEADVLRSVRTAIESEEDNRVSDLHVWKVAPNACAAVVSLVSARPEPPEHYRSLLAGIHGLRHISVEVLRCREETADSVAPTRGT